MRMSRTVSGAKRILALFTVWLSRARILALIALSSGCSAARGGVFTPVVLRSDGIAGTGVVGAMSPGVVEFTLVDIGGSGVVTGGGTGVVTAGGTGVVTGGGTGV